MINRRPRRRASGAENPHAVSPEIERISLAEASRRTGRMLGRGRSEELAEKAPPTMEDLAECIFFSPGDGRIWLNDQRMLLCQSATFGGLRREVIDLLGLDKAEALFTRIGYAQGARDAQLIRSRWPEKDLTHAFAAGPRLHTLEGFVKVETVHFEYDIEAGHYFGEFLWHDSSEADEHLAAFGVSNRPACWLQIAYPTGYTSWLFGKLIQFREVECRAMGAPHCRCIGRPVDAWGKRDSEDASWLVAPSSAQESATAVKMDEAAPVVGVSSRFATARHMLERVSRTRATVLLVGESGVGKELFARTLHEMSNRHGQPFVAVNCAAIPDTLMEAELFGVDKGAYTGAVAGRAGRFERAQGGTLFLDEIASLSLTSQGKLLRALQEREIERVGGSRTIAVDVRLVAATNVDLRSEIRAGRFREDLFFRLNVFPIPLPPLRERRDDIPLLMEHFLRLYSREHAIAIRGFTRRAVEALLSYDFPGNVRELQNLVERGVVFAEPGGLIDISHMFRGGEALASKALQLGPAGNLRPSEPAGQTEIARPGQTFEQIERRLYVDALSRHEGNVAAAARSIGLTRPAFEYRLKKYGLRRAGARKR